MSILINVIFVNYRMENMMKTCSWNCLNSHHHHKMESNQKMHWSFFLNLMGSSPLIEVTPGWKLLIMMMTHYLMDLDHKMENTEVAERFLHPNWCHHTKLSLWYVHHWLVLNLNSTMHCCTWSHAEKWFFTCYDDDTTRNVLYLVSNLLK